MFPKNFAIIYFYYDNKNLFLEPMMFFDCGMHAREWISSATCLYIIQVGTHDVL
jgi:hypothetical protein